MQAQIAELAKRWYFELTFDGENYSNFKSNSTFSYAWSKVDLGHVTGSRLVMEDT